MKLIISRLIAVLFMLFSVQSFAQWDCKYRRPDVLNCKLCSVTEGIGFSYYKYGGNCWGCTRTCTAITPIAPSSTGGQSDMGSDHNDYLSFTPDELRGAIASGDSDACALGVNDTNPTPFYALRLNRKTVEDVAALSPAAAQALVVLREAPIVPPLRVHGGEGLGARAPTAQSVMRLYDDPSDDDGAERLATALDDSEALLSRLEVETLKGGHVLLVVYTHITDDQKNVRSSERPFAIELKAIDGAQSQVWGNDQRTAQVYEVVSFKYRDLY